MTKSKALICSIIGPSGKSGDILAEAVDRVSGVLSPEGDLPFDFQWERDIFYEMGKKYGEQPQGPHMRFLTPCRRTAKRWRKSSE